MLGSVLYNSVYPATRDRLHGLVFLLGAATLLVPAALLYGVHRRLRAGGQLHQPPTAGDRQGLAAAAAALASDEPPPPPRAADAQDEGEHSAADNAPAAV